MASIRHCDTNQKEHLDAERGSGIDRHRIADSVHKVFSSTFEHFPNGRGEHPVRIARMSAIDVGIHAIRAGRHLCDEALRYLWTGTSRH